MHAVNTILFDIFIMITASLFVRETFGRFKLPIVAGEIIAGAVIGPYILGWVSANEVIEALATLGILVLMFNVGHETRLSDMAKVGKCAVLVGLFGVLVPLGFGFTGFYFLGYNTLVSLFMGTAMVATSVGITARVLSDMGVLSKKSSQIILGAAIFDDILGLMVLALVSGLSKGKFQPLEFGILFLEAVLFVVFFTAIGTKIAGRVGHSIANLLHNEESVFYIGLSFLIGLSLLAEFIGLASIIGAFLAGIVLSESEKTRAAFPLQEPLEHLGKFFVPFFFLVMGTKLNLVQLFSPKTLGILLFCIILAVISKIIGSVIGTWNYDWKTRIQTGIGMIPRGEVGIVVGTLGLSLGIINQDLYGVVIGMSIMTTLIVPPLLNVAHKDKQKVTKL